MYVSGRVDIFDMVHINLFTVVALNTMVLKLGYTGKFEPMFYNYLRPLTSLDEGLYALACEEDVRCLATLVRSFKLIGVYIEHGVTALDSYLRAPQFRATLEEITNEPSSIAVMDDVMRQLSFDKTELDGEAGFANVAGSEPILAKVSTQEPIVAEVSTEVPIVEEDGTQEFSVEDVVLEDYVSFGEDAKQDTTYETEYDVQSSEDAGTDDDDVDKDFLVYEENEIVEPDVDVHLFGIRMDLPFDNISVTNLVLDDVLEGEDVDIINGDGFESDPGNVEEKNYRKRSLAELRIEMEGVMLIQIMSKNVMYIFRPLEF
ncbi:hypothetical protein Tco_0479016 [Tanacetum coccineum]